MSVCTRDGDGTNLHRKSPNSEKIVWVDVIDGQDAISFSVEVSFSNPNQDKGDISYITQVMKTKVPSIRSALENGSYTIQCESSIKRGKWIVVGERDSVKDGVELRCVISSGKTPANPPTATSASSPQQSQSGISDSGFEEHLVMGRDVDKTPCEEYSLLRKQSCSESFKKRFQGLQSEGFLPDDYQQSQDEQSCGSSNRLLKDKGQTMQPVASTSSKANRHQRQQKEQECNSSNQTSRKRKGSDVGQAKGNAKVKKDEPTQVKLDTSKYKLPTNFNYEIDQLLSKKRPLNKNQYSLLCRRLSSSIEESTLHPHPDSVRFVVDKFLRRYPHVVIQDTDFSDSSDFLCWKISRQFEGKRRNANVQYTKKGGRPKTSKESKGPSGNVEIDLDVDKDSYEANKKMLREYVRKGGNAEGIRCLCKATHVGRRAEIYEKKLSAVEILENICPVLNQTTYLQGEMDLILGEGTCQKFIDNWNNLVPQILELAFATANSSKNIKSVLQLYEKKTTLLKSKESSSCAALEVLPFLVEGKLKSLEARRHLFDVREDTDDLDESIKKPKRLHPFLLKIGGTFHVVVDCESILTAKKLEEGLLNLFCCLYSFSIHYSDAVKPAFLFIQSQVLKKEDSFTKGCKNLSIFLKLLAAQHSSTASESEDSIMTD